MRLDGQFKAGFFPTPRTEYQRIFSLISAQAYELARLLDPCAGEGVAIQELGINLRKTYNAPVHVYAAEVSPERAQHHASNYWNCWRYTTSIAADWKTLRSSNNGFQLLWLNPPYDWGDDERDEGSKKKARQEYLFLRDTLPKLQHEGVLVYIVPEKMLTYPHVRNLLSTNLKQINAYRFSEEEYAAYHQIVILGRRRDAGPSPDQDALLEKWATTGVPEYEPGDIPTYRLPMMEKETVIFQRSDIPDADLLSWLAQDGGVHSSRAFLDYIAPVEADFQPLVAPRTGHAATLLASGMMGVIPLGDTLIKGTTTQAVIHYDAENNMLSADNTDKAKRSVSTFSSEITELNIKNGEFRTYSSPEDLQELFTLNARPLTEAIFSRYKPLYDGHINGQQAALDKLIPTKMLPGMKKPGLLPLQKQLAVAAETACRKYGVAIIVGEMGIGKSGIGLAAGEVLNAYPMVVLTPTHLVQKWIRECTDIIPDSHPVELDSIAAVDAFFAEYKDPAKKGIAILSKETAKAGPGWTPSNYQKLHAITLISYDEVTGKETTQQTMQRFATCPTCGQSQKVFTLGKHARKFCKAKVIKIPGQPAEACGAPLYQYGRLSEQQIAKRKRAWENRGVITTKAFNDAQAIGHKWPLSRYIKHQQYKFGLLLADEIHKYKGKTTDQGRAFHNLVKQSKYTIGLTGTLFGGRASDLYFMLYRMFPRTFKAAGYKFSAESAFIQKYGRQETIYRGPNDKEKRSGSTTGIKREVIEVKEIPGISPGIYRWVLPFAVFAKIDDLGVPMPKFTEKITRIPMEYNQRAQYDAATNLIMGHIRSGYGSYDSTAMREAQALLSVYMWMARTRPNSSFRREELWWRPVQGRERIPYWIHPDSLPDMPTTDLGRPDEPSVRSADPEEEREYERTLIAMLEDGKSGADSEGDDYEPEYEPDDEPDSEPVAEEKPKKKKTRPAQRSMNEDAPRPPKGMEPMVMDPSVEFGQLLPKEQWLIDTIKEQVKRGRSTLVYVEQSGTRDIQPRLQHILELEKIHTVILPDGNTSGREQWIRENPSQVLITNPAKVETGLDLVQFQTIVFYEMTYSLFVFWQALRRVWRLGQTKPVEVHYAVYENSVEEQAFALMGHKMKAAHLLYGDSVETAVSGAVDTEDIMAELAAKILAKQHITTDGITGLVGDRPETYAAVENAENAENAEDAMGEEITDYTPESEDATIPAGEAVIMAEYSKGEAEVIEEPAAEEEATSMVNAHAFFAAIEEATRAEAATPPDPKLLRVGHLFTYYGRQWVLTKPANIRGIAVPSAQLVADKSKVRTWKSVEHFELDSGLVLADDWAGKEESLHPIVDRIRQQAEEERRLRESVAQLKQHPDIFHLADVAPVVTEVVTEVVPVLPEVEVAIAVEVVREVVHEVVPQPEPKKTPPNMADLYARYGKNARGKAA